jgi:hypothetical protein
MGEAGSGKVFQEGRLILFLILLIFLHIVRLRGRG